MRFSPARPLPTLFHGRPAAGFTTKATRLNRGPKSFVTRTAPALNRSKPVVAVPGGSSLPRGGTTGSETADFAGQSRPCGDGLGSRCAWQTHVQVGSVRVKLAGWIRSGKSAGTGLRWDQFRLLPASTAGGTGMIGPPHQGEPGLYRETLNMPMKLTSALGTQSAKSQFRANPATAGRTCSLLQRCTDFMN